VSLLYQGELPDMWANAVIRVEPGAGMSDDYVARLAGLQTLAAHAGAR
jgi:hypothetical protein